MEMTAEEWNHPGNHVLGMLIRAEATDEMDEQGRPVVGDAILLLLNGGARSKQFVLPMMRDPGSWNQLIDTAHPVPRLVAENTVNLVAHSLMLLRYDPPK
jgi:hypothetical protein